MLVSFATEHESDKIIGRTWEWQKYICDLISHWLDSFLATDFNLVAKYYCLFSTTELATKYVYCLATDFPLVTKYNCLFFSPNQLPNLFIFVCGR